MRTDRSTAMVCHSGGAHSVNARSYMSRTGREISFHLSDDGATNTSNGSFYIRDDEGELAFKSLFGSFRGSQEKLVGPEEVAEQIWSAFFEPLSRTR